MTDGRVAVVAGANSGLGSALAALLARREYSVAALGREAGVRAVTADVPSVLAVPCDLDAERDVERAFATVETTLGTASVVVYNAHRIELRPSLATPPQLFEDAWRASCFGAFMVARRALPAMLSRGSGTLVFSGATSSWRGGRRSVAFSSAKFALRGLAQSLAREHSAAGIHVAHIVLDGLIWSERTRERFAAEEQKCMSADAVAAAYLSVIEQPPSAWTHELDLRPWSS